MNRFILLAALWLVLVIGCKKKPNDVPPDSAPPPISPTPSPSQSLGGGGGIAPAGGVGVAVNPSAALGGGGGGAVQAVRKAVRRTEALNEMRTLGQVITFMQNDLGRMPSKDQIMVELKAYPKLLAAVNEGAFILTGTSNAGGLWAYEVDADTKPGIALIAATATRTTPEDIQQYLRKE